MSEIKIVVEGTAQDGSFELQHFSSLLKSFNGVLTGLDADLHGRKTLSFLVTDLSRNSPHTLTFTQNSERADTADVFQVLMDELPDVQQGAIPKIVSERTLESLKSFTGTATKRMRTIALCIGEKKCAIDVETDNQVAELLAPKEYCFTEIEGVLEQINIHAHANTFFIYPDIGPSRVKCHFDEDLRYDAMGGLGQKVAVRGKARFRRDHPNEIWVERLELFPPEEELPTFEDLRGVIAQEFEHSPPSEALIGELRDEWT